MLQCKNCGGSNDVTTGNKLDKDDLLMSTKEAAKYIGFQPGTLAVWRCRKRYDLKPLKLGKSVKYRKSALDAFLLRGMQP